MLTSKLNKFYLLIIGVILSTFTTSVVNVSDMGESNVTKAQAITVVNYPPMYDVYVKVCGDIIAPVKNGKRCIEQKLNLWGPVKEAKLIRTGISLAAVSAVEHKIAIFSKGCYPAYSKPSQQHFYWTDTTIFINKKGGIPKIEFKKTLLSNSQIHELIANQIYTPRIAIFGGVGCEPAFIK
jgi:hypothetical protein